MKTSTIFEQIWKVRPRICRRNEGDSNIHNDNNAISPCLRQIYAVTGPLLLTIGVGAVMGYSAILLPQIQETQDIDNFSSNSTSSNISDTSGLKVDQDEASWIASMAALPMAIGTLLGGYLIEKYGRKNTHIIACLPKILGWITIGFSNNLSMLIIGRTLTGLSAGILATATGVYIGEVSEPKYRGFLLGAISLAVAGGLLLIHIIGTFLTWQTTALLNLFIPVTSVILMYFVPESPSWLAKKGNTEDAQTSFVWFRGTGDSAQNELKVMIQKQTEDDVEKATNFSDGLLRPEFLKPLAITVTFFIICQWSGPNAITFYSVSIMRDTIGNGLNEYLCMSLIDLLRVVFSIVACIFIRHYDRRPLAIISGIGTSVSLLALSAYGFLVKDVTSQLYFIPVVALMAYIVFISIGYVALPWAMIGEILPLANRSFGSGLSAFIAFVATFSVVKTSPEMFSKLGTEGTFLCYGIVAFLGIFFVYFYLPETRGKTLQEIEDKFSSRKGRISDNERI